MDTRTLSSSGLTSGDRFLRGASPRKERLRDENNDALGINGQGPKAGLMETAKIALKW